MINIILADDVQILRALLGCEIVPPEKLRKTCDRDDRRFEFMGKVVDKIRPQHFHRA